MVNKNYVKLVPVVFAPFILLAVLIIGLREVSVVQGSTGFSSESSVSYTYTVFLPLMVSSNGCDISGYATLNGQPASNITMNLDRFDWGKNIVDTAVTADNGFFCFKNIPVLDSCANYSGYIVFFGDWVGVPSQEYVTTWRTDVLTRCSASQVYTNIQAELSDITVLSPIDNITTQLPISFNWAYPYVPDGYYTMEFWGDCETINAGYTQSYVITTTPCLDRELGTPIQWYLSVIDSKGNYRSSQVHSFTIVGP